MSGVGFNCTTGGRLLRELQVYIRFFNIIGTVARSPTPEPCMVLHYGFFFEPAPSC